MVPQATVAAAYKKADEIYLRPGGLSVMEALTARKQSCVLNFHTEGGKDNLIYWEKGNFHHAQNVLDERFVKLVSTGDLNAKKSHLSWLVKILRILLYPFIMLIKAFTSGSKKMDVKVNHSENSSQFADPRRNRAMMSSPYGASGHSGKMRFDQHCHKKEKPMI